MPNRIVSASSGISAVISCVVQSRPPGTVTPWSSRVRPVRHQWLRISRRSPACSVPGVGADLAAEDDGGAAVIVGEDRLDQGGGPAGRGTAEDKDRGRAVGGG